MCTISSRGKFFREIVKKNSFVALKTTTHHQSSQFGQKLNLAHCGQISKTLNDEIEIIIMQLQYPAMKD